MSAKVSAQEIIQDVLRVAEVVGRIPSRPEYSRSGGRYPGALITQIFGSYAMMLKASGLAYSRGRINQAAIQKQSHEFLVKESDARRLPTPPKLIHRLLCISDMHKPYGHPDTEAFIFALDEKYHFDHVLIGGDEIDHHAMSFHDKDADLPSAGHELNLAISQLKMLYLHFPNVDVLESNHGSLVYRKGKHHGFPRHVLKSYNEILQAPLGWTWREEFYYQFSNGHKAVAHHGYSSNTLLASQKRAMSLIQFHFHSDLSIRYWQSREGLFWALQSGCLIDDTSRAMAYNKLTVQRPIIGCSGVIDGLPVLFPMPLDLHGRWTGVVP